MKKIISFLLAITLMLSTFSGMSVSVSAAGYDPQRVVNVALSKVGTNYANGYCLAFIRQVFEEAYGFSSTACCAYRYGSSYIDSTSRYDIPLGADVFFGGSSKTCSACGNKCGHIGIYVGDDYVVHGWNGKIEKYKIDRIINSGYPYRGWGWHGNVSLDGSGSTVSENPDDYPVPTRNLYYTSPVMTGDDVRWVQAVLRKLGYTKYCTVVDGSFGPGTRDDVRCFQYDHGLTVDCSVGPATRGLLKELWEQKKQSEVKLTSLSVASLPNKTTYFVGDLLDTTGLTLTASYSNGTSKTVTSGFATEEVDFSTPGTKTINVIYAGKTASFNVTVKELVVDKHYTVAYDPNGGTGNMVPTDMVVGTAKNLAPNVFKKAGFTFAGWALDRNAQSPVYYDKQSVINLADGGTVTLYAVWQSQTTPALRLDNVTAVVGQQVQIPIYIDNADILYLSFGVKYDPSVLEFVSESETAFDLTDVTNNAAGSLIFTAINEDNAINGKIAVLTFNVLAKDSTRTTVRSCESEAYDGFDNNVLLMESESVVNVTTGSKKGDINGDGKISIVDVRWLLQVVSGKRTPSDITICDINGDGRTSIVDVRWLLQAVSGKRTL